MTEIALSLSGIRVTRSKNKNGKIAKSDAHHIWDRLKKYEEAVLRFAHDPNVPFTNNRAEQD